MPSTVAALYVDARGCYADAPDVDLWPESRDARLYDGPWPVVAHPPCNRWCRLSSGRLRGQDGGTFAAALAAVRRFGGVLEHPADSQAWRKFGLPHPNAWAWTAALDDPGLTAELDQWWYGFPTRKRTWLYYVGDSPVSLTRGRSLTDRGCENLHSAHRIRTPPAFRDVLLALARSSSGHTSDAAIRDVTTGGQ